MAAIGPFGVTIPTTSFRPIPATPQPTTNGIHSPGEPLVRERAAHPEMQSPPIGLCGRQTSKPLHSNLMSHGSPPSCTVEQLYRPPTTTTSSFLPTICGWGSQILCYRGSGLGSKQGGFLVAETTHRRVLAEELQSRTIIPFAGIYDVFSAGIAARHYDALFVSGFGFAASYYGLPDIGFNTWTDVTSFVQRLRNILPDHFLLVDIDDGFCDIEVAAHTVRVLETVVRVRCGVGGPTKAQEVWALRRQADPRPRRLPREARPGSRRPSRPARRRKDGFERSRRHPATSEGVLGCRSRRRAR